jgi:hypothetical protein
LKAARASCAIISPTALGAEQAMIALFAIHAAQYNACLLALEPRCARLLPYSLDDSGVMEMEGVPNPAIQKFQAIDTEVNVAAILTEGADVLLPLRRTIAILREVAAVACADMLCSGRRRAAAAASTTRPNAERLLLRSMRRSCGGRGWSVEGRLLPRPTTTHAHWFCGRRRHWRD